MRADINRLFVWMTVFFMAMAFLESSVVVYLRALYYPSGFAFPLVPMDQGLVTTEVFREFATMVMLLVPGALVTRSATERFAWFCFGFGVWDIFYYVWLKALIGWPESLATLDLLFLIPVPWIGPVWAPCLVSLGLIVLALILLRGRSTGRSGLVDRLSWGLLVCGALLIVISFLLGPAGSVMDLDDLVDAGPDGIQATRGAVSPHGFALPWFLVGTVLASVGLVRSAVRSLASA